MTLPQIISRNQIQKLQGVSLNGRVVLQPNTWYTCPTGRKAIVKGSVQCTGRGAAANADFEVSGVVMFSWTTAVNNVAGDDYTMVPRGLSTSGGGQFALFEVELAAGDIIETTQNTGTNAEFNLFANVIETPT